MFRAGFFGSNTNIICASFLDEGNQQVNTAVVKRLLAKQAGFLVTVGTHNANKNNGMKPKHSSAYWLTVPKAGSRRNFRALHLYAGSTRLFL